MLHTDMAHTARSTMDAHGLQEWQFRFDGGKNRFGQCNYSTKTISMSRALVEVNTPDRCMNTLLHEIAHALVGRSHGHDRVWQIKARAIGCDGKARYSSANTVTVHKWEGVCPNCGITTKAHRRNLRGVCARCYNTGKGSYSFQWSEAKISALQASEA